MSSVNANNYAIRRIMADVRELQKHPSSRYNATPMESNMFEWHFTIRGPHGSDFEGGTYHGRILLPAEYPFKPPNVIFLTKNGRFETNTKICLSISAYHEESWQPAWGVRTMLEAIISFLPSEGAGAIGALDWTKEERKKLAFDSQSYICPTCGCIKYLLSEYDPNEENIGNKDEEIERQIAQLSMGKLVTKGEQTATVDSIASSSDDSIAADIKSDKNNDGDTKMGGHKSSGPEEITESPPMSVSSRPAHTVTTSVVDAHKDVNNNQVVLGENPIEQPQRSPTVAVEAISNANNPPQAQQQQQQPQQPQKRDIIDDILLALLAVIGVVIAFLAYRIINKDRVKLNN